MDSSQSAIVPADGTTGLALFERARQALAEARTVDEVKQVRDQAQALQLYARQARESLVMQNDIAEIKLRAERRLGEMLAEQEKQHGARGLGSNQYEVRSHDATPPTLADIGISKSQSSRWQKVARLSDNEFEQHVEETKAAGDELTTASVFRALGRIERQQQREHEDGLRTAPVVMPASTYRCIVIDPPWPVQKINRDVRPLQSSTLDYPTMTLEEIEGLQVDAIADPDGCHLYLWVTQKYLPVGLELVEMWGFKYQCLMTWVKPTGITPFSWMYNTEHVIYAHRGGLKLDRMGLKLAFEAKVTGHSVKPDVFYERVEQASPGPRLEMFARRERSGFDTWGNEVSDGD